MAKLYKVRKKCLICGSVFYPKYAGSLYCEKCKTKKKKESERKKKLAAKSKKKSTKKLSPQLELLKKLQKKK